MMASSDDSTTAASRRLAASARFRSLMSRAIFDAPMTVPSSSRIGDTVSEIGTSDPSLRRRIVSKCVTDSPAPDAREHVVFLGLPIGGDDHPNGAADRLGGRVAEHPFGGAVPGRDDAVQILADDRVVRRFDDLGEMARGDIVQLLRHARITARRAESESSHELR